jgi:TonB family protein
MSALFLLTWLAGTLLPLGALWLVYRLALRGERCFGYNRAFLLLAPVLAAVLPLLPRPAMPLWLNSPAVAVAASKTGAAVLLPTAELGQAVGAEAGWPAWAWLGVLYLAGVALGLGRLAWQAGRLWVLARRLPREERPGYALAYTGGRLPTSSFGRVIFWDETTDLAPAEAAAVLTHELAHVQQRHTLDVLWLEAWRVVLWPNPFSHLLLPALRLTHELLADAAATAEAPTSHATPYPTLLARLATRQVAGPTLSLLQPFTFSFTLTRIAMLQNQNPVRRWKQWLVLPALGGLFFIGSHAALAQGGPVPQNATSPRPSEAQQKERLAVIMRKLREAQHQDSARTGNKLEPGTMQQFYITNMQGPGEPMVTITRVKKGGPDGVVDGGPKAPGVYGQTPAPPAPRQSKVGEPGSGPATINGQKVYSYVEEMPQLPGGGGQPAIVNAILSKVVYPKAAPGETLPDGRVFANFMIDADGAVQEPKIMKGLSPAFDEAVLSAIKQLPRFEPGKQGGQPVAVSFTVPIQFQAKP